MTVLSKTFRRGKSATPIMNMTGNVIFWYLLGAKLPWGHSHKTRSWYLLGVIFNDSDEHPRHFYMGVPPGGEGVRRQLTIMPVNQTLNILQSQYHGKRNKLRSSAVRFIDNTRFQR